MKKQMSLLKRTISLLTAACLVLLVGCSGTPGAPAEPSPSPEVSASPTPAQETPSPSPTAAPEEEAPLTPKLTEREVKWREDLDYLSAQYKELHPNPFLFVTEKEFDFRLEQLKDRIFELSDTDMYFELQQIMAGFCDVHTILPITPYVTGRIFPFGMLVCGEKIYLYTYDSKYAGLLEPHFLREIVAVNGMDMSYIQHRAEEFFYPANPWYGKEIGPDLCRLPAFYDWLNGSPQEEYTFHILDEDGRVELVDIPPMPYTPETVIDYSYPERFSLPQSRYNLYTNHAEYIEDARGGYVYMAFPYMESGEESDYQEFFDATTELLESHPNCKLVVDLRKNSGGTSYVQGFVQARAQSWKELPIDKTYILTGGRMASAAIDLCTVFKETMNGTTVGEPTGQYPATFGNRQEINLPNSGLDVVIAEDWFGGMHPEEYRRNKTGMPYVWQSTVMPDVYVPLDVEDFRQGRDSLIEWVLEHE